MSDLANLPDFTGLEAAETELAAFIAFENRLLDENHFEQWLALFTDDGHYWIPSTRTQTDPLDAPSIAYDDRLLLSIKIKRMNHPQAHSLQPAPQGLHVLQPSRLTGQSADGWTMRTPLIYFEQRADRQIQVPATATHHLIKIDGTLRIRLKRVDILQAPSPLPMIQLFP